MRRASFWALLAVITFRPGSTMLRAIVGCLTLLCMAHSLAVPGIQSTLIWDQSVGATGASPAALERNLADEQNFAEPISFGQHVLLTGIDLFSATVSVVDNTYVYGAVGTP